MWMLIIVSLILLLFVSYFFMRNKKYKVEQDISIYKPKDFLLSKSERTVYNAVCGVSYRHNMKVFPKMRLTEFIWVPRDNRNAYLKIQGKFVDFLLVDSFRLHPKFAIFINNKENKAKMLSKVVIKSTLDAAGIKLIILPSEYSLDVRKIREIVEKALEDYYGHIKRAT